MTKVNKKEKSEKNNEKRLMTNAIDSISLGVEDFRSEDPRRVISAIRNIYAGVLLLCKQVLWNASPEGSSGSLIYKDLKLKVINGKGQLVPKNIYGATINRHIIQTRLKDLNYEIDWEKFGKLAKVRNQIEHSFIENSLKHAREALALAMPIIVDVLYLLEADPDVEFDTNIWNDLLRNGRVFDAHYEVCLKTFSNIEWPSDILKRSLPFARCKICRSPLVRQMDKKNTKSKFIKLRCGECGKFQNKKKVFEEAVDSLLQCAIDNKVKDLEYVEAAKCLYCDYRGWIDSENLCVLCEVDIAQCSKCGESFKPDELDDDSTCYGCIVFRKQMQKND